MSHDQLPGVFGDLQPVLELVILVAALAAIVGDNIGFAVGRFGGRPLVERFGRYIFLTPARLDRAEDYFSRHGGKIVVIARFVEGLRQVNGMLAGTVGMHWLKFLGFNALGAALWVCWWSLLGCFAGEDISEIYAGFERYKWCVIGAAAVIIMVFVTHRMRRARASTPETP